MNDVLLSRLSCVSAPVAMETVFRRNARASLMSTAALVHRHQLAIEALAACVHPRPCLDATSYGSWMNLASNCAAFRSQTGRRQRGINPRGRSFETLRQFRA